MQPAFTTQVMAGGCRAELSLENLDAAWGHPVRGELRLWGAGLTRSAHRAEVLLCGSPEGPVVGRESPLVMDSARWVDLPLHPTEPRIVRFQVRMGWGASFRLPADLQVNVEWGAHRTRLDARIAVVPPPEFALIARVAGEEALLTGGTWQSIDAGDGASVTFNVPAETKEIFDGLSLVMYRGEGVVYGKAFVDPQERSLKDTLRSATGIDVRKVDFRLPWGVEQPARQFFHDLMRPYVNKLRELPIPADRAAASTSELPLPAEEGGRPR